MSKNKYVISFFSWFWRNWLKDCKVTKVKGWRTATIENKCGNRYTSTFVPKWTFEYWQRW